MTKRLFALATILITMSCGAGAAESAPAKESVHLAIAAKVSSLMQKNTEKVTTSNTKAIKGLKALLAKCQEKRLLRS